MPISNPNIAIVLYYDWRREKTHQCQGIVGWKAALLQRGEQAIDKERDIREVRSDARALGSGLAQAQPIKGVL